MTNQDTALPEFSFEIDLNDFGKPSKRFQLVASSQEREQLAKRLATPAVEKLEGHVEVTATASVVRLRGEMEAVLVRECVASLELMKERITESFELEFSRSPLTGDDPFDLEASEVIEGDTIDLGEVLVQQLSLSMAPFPRKPDAPSLADAFAPPERVSPFAALKGVLGKSDDNQ